MKSQLKNERGKKIILQRELIYGPPEPKASVPPKSYADPLYTIQNRSIKS